MEANQCLNLKALFYDLANSEELPIISFFKEHIIEDNK